MRLIDADDLLYSLGASDRDMYVAECINEAPTVEAVVLPCKIGDPVWFVGTSTTNKLNKGVIETSVEKLVLKNGGVYMKLACNAMYETSCKSIGKPVFFTREEAEAALAKMKGGAENA